MGSSVVKMMRGIWSTVWGLFLPYVFVMFWIVLVPSAVTDILRGFRISFDIYLTILFFTLTTPIMILALWVERRRARKQMARRLRLG